MPLNNYDLMHSYKAMLSQARFYDLELDEKHEELEEDLLNEYDLSVHDMLGSLDNVYKELKKRHAT